METDRAMKFRNIIKDVVFLRVLRIYGTVVDCRISGNLCKLSMDPPGLMAVMPLIDRKAMMI